MTLPNGASRAGVLRRDALALLGGMAAGIACGGSRSVGERKPARQAVATLKLDPVVDMVPAAGLIWLVDARPRELLASPVLGPAVSTIIPDSRFDTFAEHHGGIDVRRADQLAVAAYAQSTLVSARVAFDPDRIEEAFAARVAQVEGRVLEPGVLRTWGSVPGGHEGVALLAHEALLFERGNLGPLRGAVYFAQGRLRRSLPALRAEPLASAAALAGDAPLRVFAPGPFEGDYARGIAGLLRVTTAVATTLRPSKSTSNGAVAVQLLLTGGWDQDGPAAAERLRAAFGVLAADALGQLTGLDHPIEGPTVSVAPGALRLDVTLDAMTWARGVHAATGANLSEIMAY